MPNRLTKAVLAAALLAAATSWCAGQIFPRADDPAISVQAGWMKLLSIPPGNPAAEIPLILDPSPAGKDLLHIWTPEPVPVSLRLPAGTIVNASNAQSLGFTFGQQTSGGTDPVGDDFGGLIEIGSVPGTHTVILFPQNQAAGTYKLVVDTSGKATAIGGMAEWHSTSPLVAGCQTESETYRAGEAVTVVCVLLDDETPVANVTLSGEVQPQIDVSASVTVGNAQLLRKEDGGDGFSLYVYRVRLQNNSGLLSRFIATADTEAEDVTLVRAEVGFDPIAAGQPGDSLNELAVSAPTSPGFNPATLDWKVIGAGSPVALSLTDAGPGNDGLGDGIYSGQFTASQPGVYSIRVEATGVSPGGKPFFRVALAEIEAIAQPATIGATTDSGVDSNGDGKNEAIRINTAVNVIAGGDYVLNFGLFDAQGKLYGVTRVLSLEAGSHLVTTELPAQDLARAGLSNGPYEIRGLVLSRRVANREAVADYQPLAHTTAAYSLGDFELGSIYFTGQATEQALNLDEQLGFDELRVQAEVIQRPGVTTGTMNCRMQGKLTSAEGFVVDAVNEQATISEGTHLVAIRFRGPKIARSNVDGPYSVRDVSIECSGMRDSKAALLTTTGYLAADFQSTQPDFFIDKSVIDLMTGETRTIPVYIRGLGAYEGTVTLSVLSVSPGLTASVDYPEVVVDSLTTLKLTTGANTSAGNYTMELSATDGTLTRMKSVPVVVTGGNVQVEVTVTGPASLRPGMSTQFAATVTNATNSAVTWTVSPSVGTVNASGLYTAPSSIASQQTVTVTATSAEDGTKSASATVTLLPAVGVSVSPGTASLRANQMQQFGATVTNATNMAVTWTVSPSVGSVNASGLYTATSSIASQQTVTVTATSVEDGTKAASATVTLLPAVSVSVSPGTASLRASQTQQFTATVTNATNSTVTWTVSPSVGFVNASGLYTAPASIASQQTVTVTATSVEDGTKAASATVTLLPAVGVSISPPTASLYAGGMRQFAATVTNATNTGVTWTRSPGVGTLSASGLYTAPGVISSQQTVTVTATSVEDGTKSASAAVTLMPPANSAPTIQGASPSNGAGWATVFKYEFADSNGAADIATAEVSYSTGSSAPFANSCWFVYSKSTNAVKLYNNTGTGFVSGQIVADTSGGNLSNSRCTLVGGSLKAYPAGNTLTLFLGIGFATGTARNYTARLKATDTAGAATSYSPYGTWTVPATTAPPSSPAAAGNGSPSAQLSVSLTDPNNTSLASVDIDDIQTLVTKTGGGDNACHFFYFAPAEMLVLMDDDDVHWAGVSRAGPGGGALYNSKCMVNAAAAQKTYDSNTKRFGITVPVTAYGTFTGTKYVYVGGSDLSGNVASVSWVHSWTTN